MKTRLFLILIIILAFTLRVWHLDKFPATLYGDEQSFTWNAYNILKLGQDEYGNPFPLQFKAFDDYKAPIPVYLLVPFIKLFGLNTFSIRLPVAIISTLSIVAAFFLIRIFLGYKISLLATFLFAISPWHIHLSRGYFEATISLLFFICAIFYFLKNPIKSSNLILSVIFFALTLYSYFTPRILLLVFIPFLIWFHHKYFSSSNYGNPLPSKKMYIFCIFLFGLLVLPLVKMTLFDQGLSRFTKLQSSMNQIITETVIRERSATNLQSFWKNVFHNKGIVWARLVKNNYFEHLSLNFWYLYGDNSLRYFTGNMGMFYIAEMPFLLIGIYKLWLEKRKTAVFFLGWILLAPIPAALVGRSFALRSIAMLPAPFIFVSYGIKSVIDIISKKRINVLFKLIISSVFTISLGSLLIRYYLEYPVYAATWWGWENKAAIDYAKSNENMYENIFISDFYSGGPLSYAVYNSIDPLVYRHAVNNPIILADGRKMIRIRKYYYGSFDLDKVRLNQKIIPPKSLYIGRPEESKGEDEIIAPDDGRLIFVVHDTLRKDCYINNLPKC